MALVPVAEAVPAAAVHVKIDDLRFDNGAILKFLEVGSSEFAVDPEALRKMTAAKTEDDRYTLFVDLEAISIFTGFENYEFYVRRASASLGSPLMRFTFHATPYDSFPDQSKPIRIHVLEDGQDHIAELVLPVHSLKSADYLWTQPDASARVHLSGDAITIDLVNRYLMPVTIIDAAVARVADAHWKSQPQLASTPPMVLGSDSGNNRISLVWNVQPRASGILRDSLVPLVRGASKEISGLDRSSATNQEPERDALESLEFTVVYAPIQGGYTHTLKFRRSVSFYPSVPALSGAAILGAVAAGLVMFFGIRKDTGPRKFLRYIWPNILLALIIEGIAIVLFSFDNSKIQIGVVNLNPTLLIPSACLGAASVFYGFSLIEKFLGRAGTQHEPATPMGDKP